MPSLLNSIISLPINRYFWLIEYWESVAGVKGGADSRIFNEHRCVTHCSSSNYIELLFNKIPTAQLSRHVGN